MSTAGRRRTNRAAPPGADPFRYGWRDVPVKGPGGRLDYKQIPLTLEDVLHPQEGDHLLESTAHHDDREYLKEVFAARLAGDATALVLSDNGVYWDEPALRHHSPDVAVVFGVAEPKLYRASFDVAREGTRPALIVEVTSPDTRNVDLRTKRRQYYRAGVPFYAVVDQQSRRGEVSRRLRLLGYRRGRRAYEPLPLDDQGRLWLEPVGVWLGIEGERVACYDAEGRRFPTYQEVVQAQTEAERRAQSAERKNRELEAELRRVRGES